MIRINKKHEPHQLIALKKDLSQYNTTDGMAKPIKPFDNLRGDKLALDAVYEQLINEQGWLCCYCQCRIEHPNVSNHVRIEHFKPRDKTIKNDLDYKNLLLACYGGEGDTKRKESCDKSKGSNKLPESMHPCHKAIESSIYYGNGKVRSQQPDIDKALDKILCLNIPYLVRVRKSRIEAELKRLDAKKSKKAKIQEIESLLQKYNRRSSKGQFTPFKGYLIYTLNKKLRQLSRQKAT